MDNDIDSAELPLHDQILFVFLNRTVAVPLPELANVKMVSVDNDPPHHAVWDTDEGAKAGPVKDLLGALKTSFPELGTPKMIGIWLAGEYEPRDVFV